MTKYLRRGGLVLISWLLSYGLSGAQDQAVSLNDMAFVFGTGESRGFLKEAMHAFYEKHQVRLAFTLLEETSVYQSNARLDEGDLLRQPSPCLTITTWHDDRTLYYRRHEVQLNDALAQRLPEATARQIVGEWLPYYADLPPQSSMQMGMELVLLRLGEYLDALPPPDVVPTITFANGAGTAPQPSLGLDEFTHEAHRSLYEQVTIREADYPVAWKVLPSGQSTSVRAQVDQALSFPPGVVFKQNGNVVAAQPTSENHRQQVTLIGQTHEQEGVVEVYASGDEEAELVGQLNTISYDVLPRKLVLIVLDDVVNDPPYLASLSQTLQAIYAQAGVRLTVETQTFTTGWGNREVPLNDETSGLLSNYPTDLKRVIKDYRKEHQEEPETAYLFLAGYSQTGKRGYMPKKRPYGFVYLRQHANAAAVAKTVAHELGHGLFRLRHTFESYPALTKGSTDNLMDYGKGTRLHKYQWDLVHHPEAMLGWFQEEGENASYDFCEVMFKDKLNAIRKANLEEDKEVNFNWSGETADCTLWGPKVSALSLDVADFQMPMRGSINFSPSDYKRTEVAKLADMEGEFVRYDFGDFEYEDDPRVMLSVTIMKKQAGELEAFLFGKAVEEGEVAEENDEKVNKTKEVSNFDKYQKKVFDHEGGFVDDPVDRGGATNKGIIFNTFKLYAETDLGIEPTLENLKSLTNEQAAVIYKKRFWNTIRADEIKNASLAYALYDFNVNAGSNATEVLQSVLKSMGNSLTIDGKIGPKTIELINSQDSKKLFDKYKQARIDYYQKLVDASVDKYKKKYPKATEKDLLKNTQKKFEKGWKKRANSITYEKN